MSTSDTADLSDNPFTAPVADDVLRANADIVARARLQPDRWQFPMAEQRRQRAAGGGLFPPTPLSDRAETITIPGPVADVRLRVIRPKGGGGRGIYMFIHGGGWVIGSYDGQDPLLENVADASGLTVVSVSYRLAPENPYPAAPDDCEAAALWVAREGLKRLGGDRIAIGGNSVGCQLSVVSMIRLRDRHGLTPFVGANLLAGCYDLRLTPSLRSWGDEPLILNTRDMEMFVQAFLTGGADPEDPDLSPIFADLRGLPPALFTVGTRDPLLDDTLFMEARWRAAGNASELALWPGAPHGFVATGTGQAQAGLTRMDAFLAAL
jgi:acetyl esterase/lipase